VPAFTNRKIKREFLFFEHEANRALRMGKWKLVSQAGTPMEFTPEDENAWELYNLKKDPTETNNLAGKYPRRVKKMAARWEQEAVRLQAKPWPWNKQPKTP
jgi:arylsulfatase